MNSPQLARTMTLAEIAECVGAQIPVGARDLTMPIAHAASLEEATPGDIAFFEHPKYLRALRATKAEVVLVPMDFDEAVAPILLRVEKPTLAFTKILQQLAPHDSGYAAGIHPTAVVDPTAEIHPTASIQPYVVVEKGARIGAGTVIGAHTFVGRGSSIGEHCIIYPHVTFREGSIVGNRVIIHSGAVVGSDGFGFSFQAGQHVKVPHLGHVQIDDDVEIGANTAIDRARFGRTWIQHGTKIDNLVQIAHNVVIGPHCLIISQTGISGSAKLGQYVTLAGQVGVVGHIEIGDQVVVAAKSGVSKDTPAKQQLLGMIGIPIKEARELLAHYHRLPKTVAKIKALESEIQELRAMFAAMSAQKREDAQQ